MHCTTFLGVCVAIAQFRDSICCQEIEQIVGLQDGDSPPSCITTHVEFPNVCLNRTVLTIAMHGYTTMGVVACHQMRIGKQCRQINCYLQCNICTSTGDFDILHIANWFGVDGITWDVIDV